MPVTIRTDHKWKPFKMGYQVPESVIKYEFDYLDSDEVCGTYFLCYRGTWYSLDQFVKLPDGGELSGQGWHGAEAHSYSTGTLIRLSDDGEEYQIGSYYDHS